MIGCAICARQIVPNSLTKLESNIWRCASAIITTDNIIKLDVICSLQILSRIDVEKSKKVRTDENALAVEDTAAKLGNMTLTGKVVFCGYRSS